MEDIHDFTHPANEREVEEINTENLTTKELIDFCIEHSFYDPLYKRVENEEYKKEKINRLIKQKIKGILSYNINLTPDGVFVKQILDILNY
jgi:hypothetical protein